MKKLVTKGFYIVSAIILLIAAALPVQAQFSRANLETGGLNTALTKDSNNNIYSMRVKPASGGLIYMIEKYTKGTGGPFIIYGGFTHEIGDYPWGLAVDSHGNVYVSTDFTASAGKILKFTYNSSNNTYALSSFQVGRYFSALAFDTSDNLYSCEYDAANKTYAVVEYAAGHAAFAPGVNLYDNLKSASGYTYPTGLAVNAGGDVFVADAFSNDPTITDGGHVYKLTKASSYAVSTISTGQYASSLTVDAAGNLFSSENSGSGYQLVEYPAAGGSGVPVYSPMHTNGIYYPWGIAVINSDKIFAVDGDDGTLGGAIMRLTSAYTNLSGLSVSTGTLTPSFTTSNLTYAVSVPNSTTSITVTPAVVDPAETVKVNGTTVASGTASAGIPLLAGNNTINTVVTAPDGVTTKTYAITVTRAPATNANLLAMHPSAGTLTPAFNGNITSYTANIPNAVASITITPTTADATATVTVNGTAVASGTASAAIPLAVGANVISTAVTAQDGVTIKTYMLTATRAPSNNAKLLSMHPSAGILTPPFNRNNISYTASVSNAINSITVTPTAVDGTATITVNGTAVASGAASAAIPLAVGANNIATTVTAQDGVTIETYTLVVTRAPSSNANLLSMHPSSGALTPGFNGNITSYTSAVAGSTTSITITPATVDAGATVTVNGAAVVPGTASAAIPLVVGTTTITTAVTAQDGTTKKTYTLVVSRPSSNANLTSMHPGTGGLTPVFTGANTSYTSNVPNAVSSITITPATVDVNATVKINGTAVASGTASSPIPLLAGPNIINTVVTAQDGVTTKTYTLTVTRAASSNAGLLALALNNGTLSPAFATGTAGYSANVTGTVSSVTVTPTTADANATVAVNGTLVASGTASTAIPLLVGANTINTVVTAQDGVTTQTYTVTITRVPSANANLSALLTTADPLSPAFSARVISYGVDVGNSITSITLAATTADVNATLKVNGKVVKSGKATSAIPLAVGNTKILIVITAQDGVTTKTYGILVNRAGGIIGFANNPNLSLSDVENPADSLQNDGILVHQAVSPNGDGINDFLTIEGINNYPDNKLMIVSRDGTLVYEASGYDNSSKLFDGHSNKNGALQLPGTYFYSLDYKINGVNKHKTGFIILKY